MAFWQNKPNLTTPISATNLNNLAGGWTKITETLTYASADSPTFVINTSADTTSYLSVGMKIKLTQTTVKYFIITAITSTTITVYGGTDYTLANATITDAFFSVHRAPFGFPMNPDKWSVLLNDTTNRSQVNPTQNVWYNLGSISINIPIGVWKVEYSGILAITRASQGFCGGKMTLSTANNSQSHPKFTRQIDANDVLQLGGISMLMTDGLTLTSATTFYLNFSTMYTSITGLFSSNATQTLIIKAVCAYL